MILTFVFCVGTVLAGNTNVPTKMVRAKPATSKVSSLKKIAPKKLSKRQLEFAAYEKEYREQQERLKALDLEIAQIKKNIAGIQGDLSKNQENFNKSNADACKKTSSLCSVDFGVGTMYYEPNQEGDLSQRQQLFEVKDEAGLRRLCKSDAKECVLPLGIATLKMSQERDSAGGPSYRITNFAWQEDVKNYAKDASNVATDKFNEMKSYLGNLQMVRVKDDWSGGPAYDLRRKRPLNRAPAVLSAPIIEEKRANSNDGRPLNLLSNINTGNAQ